MQNGQPTLLAVLAHPDDESFGMGGTLALYAQKGAQVYLICATRGEAGDVDPKYLRGFASTAERRAAELECAAENLGLAGVQFLDYRDSGMPGTPDNDHPQALANAPVEEVAVQVAEAIRQLRPHVVLTFDPIGGYKHPDHIAIHKATVRAFELASDAGFRSQAPPYQPAKLYYSVLPKRWMWLGLGLLRLQGKDPRRYGRNGDIDLVEIVKEGDFPIHARIDYRSVAWRKDAAAQCHASQFDGVSMRRGPLGWVRSFYGERDHFMRAYPPAGPHTREADLLENINFDNH